MPKKKAKPKATPSTNQAARRANARVHPQPRGRFPESSDAPRPARGTTLPAGKLDRLRPSLKSLGKSNKGLAVRTVLAIYPEATGTEVVTALAGHGIEVSRSLVSAVRSKMREEEQERKRSPRKKRAVR